MKAPSSQEKLLEKIQSAITRAPLQDTVSPFPPTTQEGEQQVEPVLKKK